MYEVMALSVVVAITSFLLLRIWPAIEAIMRDFVIPSPQAFLWVIHVGEFLVDYWWLLTGAGLLLAWILWTEKPGRTLRRNLIRPWFDTRSADVLQNLSVVAEAGRPIPGAISTLARYHYDPTLRRQLLFVRNEVELGADLWSTLAAVKLLTPAEVALMESSQKVGNRPWAMRQLATAKRRRIRRRLELLDQLASPLAILLLGAVVLTVSMGVFVPLVQMSLYSA